MTDWHIGDRFTYRNSDETHHSRLWNHNNAGKTGTITEEPMASAGSHIVGVHFDGASEQSKPRVYVDNIKPLRDPTPSTHRLWPST